MRKRILIALFTSVMIIGFSLVLEAFNKWKRYVIEPGKAGFEITASPREYLKEIRFSFRTNPTWYYRSNNTYNWNKIRGISSGHHIENSSALLAYRCTHDSLLIVGACCYIDGKGPEENLQQLNILDTISAEGEYECRIIHEDGKYKFYFEDKYWDYPAGDETGWGYRLDPEMNQDLNIDHDWMLDLCEK